MRGWVGFVMVGGLAVALAFVAFSLVGPALAGLGVTK